MEAVSAMCGTVSATHPTVHIDHRKPVAEDTQVPSPG